MWETQRRVKRRPRLCVKVLPTSGLLRKGRENRAMTLSLRPISVRDNSPSLWVPLLLHILPAQVWECLRGLQLWNRARETPGLLLLRRSCVWRHSRQCMVCNSSGARRHTATTTISLCIVWGHRRQRQLLLSWGTTTTCTSCLLPTCPWDDTIHRQ